MRKVTLVILVAAATLAGANAWGQSFWTADKAVRAADARERYRKNVERWQAMTPEQRQKLIELQRRWQGMSEEQRHKILENYRRFKALPEEKRQAILRARSMMGHLGEKTQQELERHMREFQQMPPERRRLVTQKMITIKQVLEDDYAALRELPPHSGEAQRMIAEMRLKAMVLRMLRPEEIERLKYLAPEERRQEILRLMEERKDDPRLHQEGPGPQPSGEGPPGPMHREHGPNHRPRPSEHPPRPGQDPPPGAQPNQL